MKIRSKILLPIYVFMILGFMIIGTTIYFIVYQNNLLNGFSHLETRTALSANKVHNFTEEITKKLQEISLLEKNIRSVALLSKYQLQQDTTLYKNALLTIGENVSHFQSISPEIENIIFTDRYGIVLYSLTPQSAKYLFVESLYGKGFLQRAKQGIFISDIRLRDASDIHSSYVFSSSPMYEKDSGIFLGTIIIETSTKNLDTTLSENQELGRTGQTYLVGRDGFIRTQTLGQASKFAISIKNAPSVIGCFENNMEFVQNQKYLDFTGQEVIGRYQYIDSLDMCLITEISLSEVAETSKRVLLLLLASSILTFLCVSYLILRFIKSITSPLLYLTKKIQEVSKGKRDIVLDVHSEDEIEKLAGSFQQMLYDLKITDKKIQKKVQEQTYEIRMKQEESEKLNRELLKFEEALKKASDYVAILDENLEIVYMNRSLEKETGFVLQDCKGGKVQDFWRKSEDPTKLKDLWKQVKKGKESSSIEMITDRKDGSSFVSDVHISPILNNEKKIIFYLTIETDITQEKEVQKMKDDFISLVSHELRTPMTVIGGFTKLFLERKFGEINTQQEKYLQRIDANIKYLIHMVNDMLDLEKLNSGKIEFSYQEFDVFTLLENIQSELRLMCDQKSITLHLKGKTTLLTSDEEKIKEVLINLIRNAYKFTDPGGHIYMRIISRNKKNLRIEIEDTGIGILEEHADKIFQKFGQVQSHLQKKEEGTGLGLSICQLIIEKLGGEIGFNSIYEKGSTFYFILPYTPKSTTVTKK